MGYQEDQLVLAQKKMKDLLAQNRTGIDSNSQETRDYFAELDANRATNTQDILTGVSSRFGIDPNIAGAGADFASAQDPLLQARREGQLGQMKMKDMTDRYSKLYNYAYDQYQNAGYTLKQSEQFARQWAQRTTEADTQEQSRKYRTEKQAIADKYATMKEDFDNQESGDPYQDALIRALAGTATTAAAYGIVKGKNKKKPVAYNDQSGYSQPIPFGPEAPGGQYPYNPYQ